MHFFYICVKNETGIFTGIILTLNWSWYNGHFYYINSMILWAQVCFLSYSVFLQSLLIFELCFVEDFHVDNGCNIWVTRSGSMVIAGRTKSWANICPWSITPHENGMQMLLQGWPRSRRIALENSPRIHCAFEIRPKYMEMAGVGLVLEIYSRTVRIGAT